MAKLWSLTLIGLRYWNNVREWWFRQSGADRSMIILQSVIAVATVLTLSDRPS
jgi:hypothetical protein